MVNVTQSDLPPIEDYIQYLEDIWSTKWLTNDGKFVQSLEKELEKYFKTQNILLMANGTLALQIALKSLGIKGEVITTPFTFAATTNTILWENLTPVFADIDPKTFNIDPEDIRKKITPKTSAILPVHVYGNPCNIDEINEIAVENDIKIIYDAAHAFGVDYRNKSVLDYGDLSIISFHATKIFNTIEGGAVIAKDEKITRKIKLLRNHGIKSEEEVVLPGINAKMNEFQAALGLCNLKYIDKKIKLRSKLYRQYINNLIDLSGLSFQKIIASKYNFSYMPVCFENKIQRDQVYVELLKHGFKSRKYFYPLITDFSYFKDKKITHECRLEVASDISNRVLCLPLYPDLDPAIVDKITTIIKTLLSH